MFGVITFPPEVTFGTMGFSSAILASIWWLIYLMTRDHRAILRELRANSAETVLSKANAFRAANVADRTADAIGGLEGKLGVKIDAAVSGGVAATVSQVTTAAEDVAATLAGQTPSGTPLPAELRLIVTTETENPQILTAN